MNNSKYSIQQVTVALPSLVPHEILNISGTRTIDAYIKKEMLRFGKVLLPVAVKDEDSGLYHVVFEYAQVELAKEQGCEQMEIIVVDCPFGEAIRLCDYTGSLSKKRELAETFNLLMYLKKHLKTTPEGKQWYNDLPGNDLRQKLAYLLGYRSGGTVTKIETIGTYAPDAMKHFMEGELSFSKAYDIAVMAKRKEDDDKASLAAQAGPGGSGDDSPNLGISLWTTTHSSALPNHAATTTGAPIFDDAKDTAETPYISSGTGTPQFTSSERTLPPSFCPPKVRLYVETVGDLDLDLSGHDIRVKVDGAEKQGFTHKVINGSDTKVLQLFRNNASAITISINPSLLK